jgi:hypothetical protein
LASKPDFAFYVDFICFESFLRSSQMKPHRLLFALAPTLLFLVTSPAVGTTQSINQLSPREKQTCDSLKSSGRDAWQCRYTEPNKLGLVLEEHFGNMMVNCGINRFEGELRNIIVPLSNIPLLVQQELDLGRPVQTLNAQGSLGVSLRQAFSLMSSSESTTGLPTQSAAYFDYAGKDLPDSLDSKSFGGLMFLSDCANLVSAAIQANSGFQVPPAQIKAALTSTYSRNGSSKAGMLYGTFNSPYTRVLSEPVKPSRLFVLMNLWKWYAAQPVGANLSKRYLMQSINGVFLFRFLDQRLNVEQKFDFSGSLSTPAITTTLSTGAKGSSGNRIELSNFKLAAVPTNDNVNSGVTWVRAKTPEELANLISEHDMRLEKTPTNASPGNFPSHVQLIEGMPSEYCSRTNLQLVAVEPVDATFIFSAGPVTITRQGEVLPSCRMNVTPKYTVPTSVTATTAITFRFKVVPIKKINQREFAILSDSVTYTYNP